jgi:hypothetical protein
MNDITQNHRFAVTHITLNRLLNIIYVAFKSE